MAQKATVANMRTLTTAEMEQTPHIMRGDFAITTDGRYYIWNDTFGYWMVWK